MQSTILSVLIWGRMHQLATPPLCAKWLPINQNLYFFFSTLCFNFSDCWVFAPVLNVHSEGEWSYVLVCTAILKVESVINDWFTTGWPGSNSRDHTHIHTRASALCNEDNTAHCLSLCVVSQLLDLPSKRLFKLLRHPKHHFKDPDLIRAGWKWLLRILNVILSWIKIAIRIHACILSNVTESALCPCNFTFSVKKFSQADWTF